jgi:glutamine synthetase
LSKSNLTLCRTPAYNYGQGVVRMFQNPKEALAYIREKGVEFVDLRFTDLPGRWQHFTLPARAVDEDLFTQGAGFDGSSIRGFQEIHESDMLLFPDPTTAFLDPFASRPTLVFVADVYDPITKAAYSRDPRGVAKRAEAYLKATGIADVSYWGPEIEFFIFDKVAFTVDPYDTGFCVHSVEALANENGREGGDGLWIRPKEGYFPAPPVDKYQELRNQMAKNLEAVGIEVEVHHHEVATAGQAEIDMRFDRLTRMADKVMLYKYVVRSTAHQAGKTATFMPKPIFGDNGSGMHTHQSLWKNGTPLFYDEKGYAELSRLALHYVAGLLAHGPALAALTNPTVNSYRRLVPGYEAPVNLILSKRNRSAVVRVPMYQVGPEAAKAKRIEYRAPDPSSNPYLAFAAMLMAGLDGIERGLEPPKPVDKNLYALPAREARRIRHLPKTLDEALDALERDHAFLLKGGVFTEDLLEEWIRLKREEAAQVRLRPSPMEYYLYYDL